MTSRDLPRPATISPQVAGLIKKFFRELAIPLCPYEMYAELLGLAESLSAEVPGLLPKHHHRPPPQLLRTRSLRLIICSCATVLRTAQSEAELAQLKAVLARLPAGHLLMLGRLMAFLSLVVSLGVNKMTVANQAAVWGPNLLRPQVETEAQLHDIRYVVNLTATMIRHAKVLFDEPIALGR